MPIVTDLTGLSIFRSLRILSLTPFVGVFTIDTVPEEPRKTADRRRAPPLRGTDARDSGQDTHLSAKGRSANFDPRPHWLRKVSGTVTPNAAAGRPSPRRSPRPF